MGRLCGGVNNKMRALGLHQVAYALTIAQVEISMAVRPHVGLQALDDRQGGPVRSEKMLPHVIVNPGDGPSPLRQQAHARGADQAAGTSNERSHKNSCRWMVNDNLRSGLSVLRQMTQTGSRGRYF